MINIRKAVSSDLDAVAAIYLHILDAQDAGRCMVGWQRGVYPTRHTAQEALDAGELYVLCENAQVIAAARINQTQMPAYTRANWRYDAPADQVLVLHTLVVDPCAAGRGAGTRFVRFYETLAMQMRCPYLRMDTNANNAAARGLYKKLGYCEADVVPCAFNGIEDVMLVCLEKYLCAYESELDAPAVI